MRASSVAQTTCARFGWRRRQGSSSSPGAAAITAACSTATYRLLTLEIDAEFDLRPLVLRYARVTTSLCTLTPLLAVTFKFRQLQLVQLCASPRAFFPFVRLIAGVESGRSGWEVHNASERTCVCVALAVAARSHCWHAITRRSRIGASRSLFYGSKALHTISDRLSIALHVELSWLLQRADCKAPWS